MEKPMASAAMRQTRKDMSGELQALQDRLRALLRANMRGNRRTRALLRDAERQMEKQFVHLNFNETSWYISGKRFRKEPQVSRSQRRPARPYL